MATSVLTLATPIVPPPIDTLYVTRATDVNDGKKTISLEFAAAAAGVEHQRKFILTMTNGQADCLVANPAPTFQDVLLQSTKTSEDDSRLAHAFDLVMQAYITGGMAGVLTEMVTLGLIPVGPVTTT